MMRYCLILLIWLQLTLSAFSQTPRTHHDHAYQIGSSRLYLTVDQTHAPVTLLRPQLNDLECGGNVDYLEWGFQFQYPDKSSPRGIDGVTTLNLLESDFLSRAAQWQRPLLAQAILNGLHHLHMQGLEKATIIYGNTAAARLSITALSVEQQAYLMLAALVVFNEQVPDNHLHIEFPIVPADFDMMDALIKTGNYRDYRPQPQPAALTTKAHHWVMKTTVNQITPQRATVRANSLGDIYRQVMSIKLTGLHEAIKQKAHVDRQLFLFQELSSFHALTMHLLLTHDMQTYIPGFLQAAQLSPSHFLLMLHWYRQCIIPGSSDERKIGQLEQSLRASSAETLSPTTMSSLFARITAANVDEITTIISNDSALPLSVKGLAHPGFTPEILFTLNTFSHQALGGQALQLH